MENIYGIIRSIIASQPWSAAEVVKSFEHKIGLCGDNGYESIYFAANTIELICNYLEFVYATNNLFHVTCNCAVHSTSS